MFYVGIMAHYWNGGYTIGMVAILLKRWLTIGMVAILLEWWLIGLGKQAYQPTRQARISGVSQALPPDANSMKVQPVKSQRPVQND